ncbi:MAG: two-component sensor histidine kinase [Candidatus Zixiibacteriota bacterium]|nr:MAG: two-component sensor histidine kinase [candidate division Zixibacteria bacterium]
MTDSRWDKDFRAREQRPVTTAEALPRYRKLRRRSVVATSLVALTPLIIMVIINFYQDKQAYFAESSFTVTRILSNTKRNLEFIIEERRSALSLILNEQSYDKLNSPGGLKSIQNNLNNSFGGFVDLGVINSDGIQTNYIGPYELIGRNYSEQAWFNEVLVRGFYVSDVFLGHRRLPHFVIAFKHEIDQDNYFVFRATIDMSLLSEQINKTPLDQSTDVFLVNSDCVLQTPSLFYGDVMEEMTIPAPKRIQLVETIDEFTDNGQSHTRGFAYIKGTPFILMVLKKHENIYMHWAYHRGGIIWFLLLSIILILVVIFYGAGHTIKRLRELDRRRARIFHDIEYTSKMATVGRMAAGVAHEINNPLAIINEKAGLLEDLVGQLKDFPNQEKFLAITNSITKSVERCSKVTRRLLGFAKRMEYKTETINLGELLKEVTGFQSSEIKHRNLRINYNFPENIPTIDSDRGQLQQVFLNIINNALAAIDNGGTIDINIARTDDNKVSVSIVDNGIGIPESELENIFEPFYSTKGEFGTGLGLSITNDIVQKLGGKIEVDSKPGRGTTFTVTLPVVTRRISYQG